MKHISSSLQEKNFIASNKFPAIPSIVRYMARAPRAPSELAEILARNIEEIMKFRDLKRPGVAKSAGISPRMLGHIINGTSAPTITTLQGIAKALDIPSWQLLIPHGYQLTLNGRANDVLRLYLQTNDRGREHIFHVAEREAEYAKIDSNRT